MTGWMAAWGALVVLMASAAVPTAAQNLTIESMDWSYNDTSTQTSLKVCTAESLTGSTVTLSVNGTTIQDLGGAIDDSGGLCALFHSLGKLPPPAGPTTYTLTAVGGFLQESSGSVSFALEGATIDCGSSPFLRFKFIDGTVEGGCTSPDVLDTSTCYVNADDFATNPICFVGLDPDSDVRVCVETVAFEPVTLADGTFTADALHYDDMSFDFTNDNTDVSLVELLILPDVGSSWDVVSCDGVNCIDADLEPSERRYDLCGVFTDTGNTVVQYSSPASFQYLNLQVETIDLTVDFRFKNLNPDKLYYAYSIADTDDVIETDTLDCSQVVGDDICNGFFITDTPDQLGYVAVSYQNGGDESNKIVAPVSQTH